MILLFFLFAIQTNQLSLREVTYSLLEKKHCNLIALKTCVSKLYDLERDPLVMYYLGYYHLFGFPKNQGEDYLEFCTNYGEYDMIDDMTYHSRNLTLAKQYFQQSLANPNSELMISFIQLLEIANQINPDDIEITLQYLSSIYMINSESAQVAAFTQQFNCLRYNTAITLRNGTTINKLNIIKQLVDEKEFTYYQLLDRLYLQCQDCNSIYYYGYQETLNQVQQYIDEVEVYEIDYEDHLINEQKAQNANEDAQLMQAYQYYTGNEDLGIVQNKQLAMNIYRNMSDSIQALYNLAIIEYKEQNYLESIRILEILVKSNVPAAYEQLGFMYLNGLGVPQNATIARQYYQNAVKNGVPHSALPLAILKLNEGQYEEGIKDLLSLKEEYLEAKFPLIDMYRVSKESNITCDYAINLMHELLMELYPKQYNKFIKEADDSYYLEEFAAFMGAFEPLRVEEQFLYNIKGAATQLADRLLEQSNLQEILYEIDSNENPQALLSLSQLMYYRDEIDLAFEYVDELIIKSENGTFEEINLIPAYLWKFRMNFLSFI